MTEARDESSEDQEQFLARYRQQRDGYSKAANTADVALFTDTDAGLALLLIHRRGHPFKGSWALPGGFLDVGDGDCGQGESLEAAARRELAEETGIHVEPGRLDQLGTYSDPGRDPRGRTITTVYVGYEPGAPGPVAADDAADARLFPVSALEGGRGPDLAFDHDVIVRDAIAWALRRGWWS